MFKAKPARKVVKVLALKALKDIVASSSRHGAVAMPGPQGRASPFFGPEKEAP